MVVVHGTQRFRDRVPDAASGVGADEGSRTWLGPWYATLLRRRRPVVALFVNEATLLPVLVPMAPARTLLRRFPTAVADVLAAHQVPRDLIDASVTEMAAVHLRATANRSVVGVMNEFGFLAEILRADHLNDLLGLAVHLAATPCSPLYSAPRQSRP